MFAKQFRRDFLTQASIGAGAVAGGMLQGLPRLRAEDLQLKPDLVRLDTGIEPLVQMLESTSREDVIPRVVEEIKGGTSYQSMLAALMLAAVRNVQPRPAVGFKFHSVLVVNSAHLASVAAPESERWHPILWSIDYFKATQAEEAEKSGWRLKAVDEAKVPPASQAKQLFIQAMDTWDTELADVATASLARSHSANDLFEIFARYGARDFRSIGHKAIYVANSFRTLSLIGWHHAEPILRSLAFALLNHQGDSNPAENDHYADRPGRRNVDLAHAIRDDWQNGTFQADRAFEFVDTLREASELESSKLAAERINQGGSPREIWNSVFLASGELLMQQPGIVGLHSLTTANALYFAFQTTHDELTRKWLTLQAASFVPMFRANARGRGPLAGHTIAKLREQSRELESDSKPNQDRIEAIFDQVGNDRWQAGLLTRNFLAQGGDPHQLIDEARRLIFVKGRDAHDYKFSAAVLEDWSAIAPEFKDDFLALSTFWLRGTRDGNNRLYEKTRSLS